MTIGSLFSGIGGLEKGLEMAGLGPVAWQCEIDPYCLRVLAKHWPNAKRHTDVREVGRGNAARVDVLCGGFPCQDVSLAGKRAGLAGARSGLWSEYARIIDELAPATVVIENVLGLRTSGLPRVLADLAALGFDAEWTCLSAGELGAPHLRRRLFIVATHPDRTIVRGESGWAERACRSGAAELANAGEDGDASDAERVALRESTGEDGPRAGGPMPGSAGVSRGTPDPEEQRPDAGGLRVGTQTPKPVPCFSGWHRGRDGHWRPPVSPVRGMDDELPRGVDGRRLKALGNAVVPQCAYVVGRAIRNHVEVMKWTRQ